MLANSNAGLARFLALVQPQGDAPYVLSRGQICEIGQAGELVVAVMPDYSLICDVLLTSNSMSYMVGDEVLVHAPPAEGGRGIVLGKVGRFVAPVPSTRVVVEAVESLSLKCGDASIDLRADGQVLIKGEDVTVRAKGTQRIRAGTVSIN